jgi:hypothetical protein
MMILAIAGLFIWGFSQRNDINPTKEEESPSTPSS